MPRYERRCAFHVETKEDEVRRRGDEQVKAVAARVEVAMGPFPTLPRSRIVKPYPKAACVAVEA